MKNVFDLFAEGSAKFVGLTLETTVSTSSYMEAEKRNKYLKGKTVTKVTKLVGTMLSNYTNTVNNQRKREGKKANFKPRKSPYLSYGNPNSSILFLKSNPTQWYIKYMNPQILEVTYYINGKEATPLEVAGILYCYRERKESGRQGTDKTIYFRATKFSSIKDIRFKNDTTGEFDPATLEVPADAQEKAFEILKETIKKETEKA